MKPLHRLKLAGIVTIAAALGSTVCSAATPARLLNISGRVWVGVDADILIVGFVTEADNLILLRGVSQSLGMSPINLPGSLQDGTLTLFGRDGNRMDSNDNWDNSVQTQLAAQKSGAMPLALFGKDSAMLVRLPKGLYTAHLSGNGRTTGIGMIEAYVVPEGDSTPGFLNLSIRARSAPGNDVAIAGIVSDGQEPFEVLIRGVGPGLRAYGVSNAHPGPSLTLFNNKGTGIGFNQRWETALAGLMAELGAAPLSTGSLDSAMHATLSPGSYTAHVGSQSATGVVLIEVYKRKRL